ncbi:hypothetical protein KKF34_16925 [Myxococcota bacterium]|nr:hypothetical protein [Myxococcota bacterium]MBU1379856.1 hypothetical protein [Myxococcota bacterium]MBU1498563.1 hypothetical protein [Myxococcota bacterium]
MFSIIKWIIILAICVASFTVPLGNKTLFGHVSSIWKSKEGKEFREGVSTTYCEVKDKAVMKLNDKSCPPPETDDKKPVTKKKVAVMRKNRKKK